MKVKNSRSEFTPFDLTIRVETLEEARAVYAVFNLTSNCRLFKDSADCITDQLRDFETSTLPDIVIANGVTYKEFYGI